MTKEAPLYLYSKGRSYNAGWHGPSGVVEGLRDVSRNQEKTVTFLVAEHHSQGDRIYVRHLIGVASINGELRWRWCGEGDRPDGASSSTICDFDPENLEMVVASVMINLANVQGLYPGSHIFRERLQP